MWPLNATGARTENSSEDVKDRNKNWRMEPLTVTNIWSRYYTAASFGLRT